MNDSDVEWPIFEDDMITSLNKQQREYCRKYGLDFSKIYAMTPLLHNLLNNIGDDMETQLILRDTTAKVIMKMADWQSINELTVSDKNKLAPKQKSILELFLYMNLVEGIYSEIVNTLIILLIKGGIEYTTDFRGFQFSSRFKELRKVSLSTRIRFLEKHGFKAVASAVDRDLRNSIAHLNYYVEEDGSITNKKTEKPLVSDLSDRNLKLGTFCSAIFMVIWYRFRPVKEGMSLPDIDYT